MKRIVKRSPYKHVDKFFTTLNKKGQKKASVETEADANRSNLIEHPSKKSLYLFPKAEIKVNTTTTPKNS
jgi:hypothetical protein